MAVAVLALLTWMAWQGVDALSRTERQTRERANELAALQAGLAQWATDLDQTAETGHIPAFDHNGQTTRITRRSASESPLQSPGLQVVAWTVRNGRWWRWASPPIQTTDVLRQAWDSAERWGQRGSDADRALEVDVLPATQWQVYVSRDGTWTNPLSTVGTPGSQANPMPDGVRLILGIAPPLPLTGDLQRDWARPSLGGGKS